MATTRGESFAAKGTQIANTPTAYVTTASTERAIIDKMILFNTNTTTEVVKGYTETSGGSAGATDKAFEVSIAGGEGLDVQEAVNIRLNTSQRFFLETTTATKVNLHLSGRRIVG